MAAIHTSTVIRFYMRVALPLAMVCNLAAMAKADDNVMRAVYPDFSGGHKSTTQDSRTKVPSNYSMNSSQPYTAPIGESQSTGSTHLHSAMPNPATMRPAQNGETAQEAEHKRVLENMRRAGYSQSRINAVDQYVHQTDAPGTTYRVVNGIKIRNDGMTFDQALNNIKYNGLMDTPIHADPNYYAPGTYGYYKTHGGTKKYGQWLDDGQR